MKPRRIYYRRKGKKMIIEEHKDGKTIYHKQLPDPEVMLEILNGITKKPKLRRRQCSKCEKPFLPQCLDKGICRDCRKNKMVYDEELHKKKEKCAICGFSDVVEIHHINKNRQDNNLNNLIGLCPNHHKIVQRKGQEYLRLKLPELRVALINKQNPS